MSTRALTSLAILKVNWDDGRDYIENFVPFAAEALRSAPQDEVSLPELQREIKDLFGLAVPQGALSTILRRCASHGYVRREHGIYRRDASTLGSLDIASKRAEAMREYEALLDKLAAFAKQRFEMELSPDEAESALLGYLEEGAASALASILDGTTHPLSAEKEGKTDYVVASFVAHLYEADPVGFAFLETVVKGSMLSGVLLFPELGGVKRHFDGLRVYFDTAFMLQALGLEGEEAQAPRRELIKLLYEENARLCTFEHTVDEVRSVLEAAESILRAGGKGVRYRYAHTIQHLIDAGYSPSDVELVITRLERSLQALNIRTYPTPGHTIDLGVDETKLRELLQQEVRYHRPEALHRDVESLTAIFRLRNDRARPNLESAQAVFVTTNHSLGRGCAMFFNREYPDTVAPYCILDHVFTTLVWLKRPQDAPDLPRKQIIADCFAALSPPDALWRRYHDEIERLQGQGDITDDDYALLRYSPASHNALMDLTLGDTHAFTEGTIAQVLERAHAAARAEAEARAKTEQEEKELAYQRLHDVEKVAANTIRGYELQRQAQLDSVRIRARTVGGWAAGSIQIIGAGLIGVVIFLPLLMPDLPGGAWTAGFIATAIPVGALTFAHLVFGTSLTALSRIVETRVARQAERAMKWIVRLEG